MAFDSSEAVAVSGDMDTKGLTPPEAAYSTKVLGWAQEALQDGDAFVKGQPGFEKIDLCMQAINGATTEALRPRSLSTTSSNRFGKIALDLAAGLTDIKPFWEYRTKNKLYEKQAQMFGDLSQHWWLQRFIDLRFMDAIKYALVAGTGYTHHIYDPDLDDLGLIAEDPRDVLPIRPGSYFSIQDAFGVIIRRERPTSWLKQRYPRVADRIKPDRDSSLTRGQGMSRAGRILSAIGLSTSPFWQSVERMRPHQTMAQPVTDLFTIYLHDNSRNESSQPKYVGEFSKDGTPRNNWSYVIAPKEKLYPRGRCIILTRHTIIYDGPNIYWHGLFPVNKLTLDPWPWLWLGVSPMWGLLSLQKALDENIRVVDDHNAQFARPGIIGDKNSISKAALDRLDTRQAGIKIMQNPLAGKGVQLVEVKPLDSSVPQHIQFLISEMEFNSGVRDLMGLTKLGQIPATETIEKMVENMSPANRARSRVLEAFMRDFAMMTASNFMQFYDLPRRIAILGADGETWQDFDYDPGTLVPDFLEDDLDELHLPSMSARMRGPLPRATRAQKFAGYFSFHVAPGSLLNASEITNKLMYLQLARMGYLDIKTLLEKLSIPNVEQVMSRLSEQAQIGLAMSVSPAGRKASGQTPPHFETKGDGRSTISESR